MCGFQSEYRKCKRPFPPTARAHLVADPAPPEATFQPFSRPRGSRGRLAGRPLSAPRSEAAPWGSLAPRSSPHLPGYRVPGRHRGALSPPEPFAAAPSEPPSRAGARHQPSVLSVPCERACGPLAAAGCAAAGALAWQGMVPERGEPTVFQGGACSREAARGRRTDTSAGTAVRATRGQGEGARGRWKRSFAFPILYITGEDRASRLIHSSASEAAQISSSSSTTTAYDRCCGTLSSQHLAGFG